MMSAVVTTRRAAGDLDAARARRARLRFALLAASPRVCIAAVRQRVSRYGNPRSIAQCHNVWHRGFRASISERYVPATGQWVPACGGMPWSMRRSCPRRWSHARDRGTRQRAYAAWLAALGLAMSLRRSRRRKR